MKWIAAFLLLTAACLGEEPRKPRCNAKSAGSFWPEEANTDRAAVARLSHCGVLERCVLSGWRYKWQPLFIHVSQLGKAHGSLPASCLAPPPPQPSGN